MEEGLPPSINELPVFKCAPAARRAWNWIVAGLLFVILTVKL